MSSEYFIKSVLKDVSALFGLMTPQTYFRYYIWKVWIIVINISKE